MFVVYIRALKAIFARGGRGGVWGGGGGGGALTMAGHQGQCLHPPAHPGTLTSVQGQLQGQGVCCVLCHK